MAERRMFTKKVTDDDNFLLLSSSAQALYLHLSMSADDDGFCNQVSLSMFKAHASVQDLQALLERRYIYQFDNGVIVIKHWRMANALRKDRYTPTAFQEELAMLDIKENGSYTFGNQMATKRQPMDANCLPQYREDKSSKEECSEEKESIEKESPDRRGRRFTPPDVEEVDAYIKEKGYHFDAEEFVAYYASQKWKKANGLPLSDWKRACVTWEKKREEKTENRVAQDIHRTYDMLNEWARGEQ
jgi:hypothetical protein